MSKWGGEEGKNEKRCRKRGSDKRQQEMECREKKKKEVKEECD